MKFINKKSIFLYTIQSYIDSLEDMCSDFPQATEKQKQLINEYSDEVVRRQNEAYEAYHKDKHVFWRNKRWWQSGKKQPNHYNYTPDISDICREAKLNDINIISDAGFRCFSHPIFELYFSEQIKNNDSFKVLKLDNFSVKCMINNDYSKGAGDLTTATRVLYIGTSSFSQYIESIDKIKHVINKLSMFYEHIEKSHSEYVEYSKDGELNYNLNMARHLIEERNE